MFFFLKLTRGFQCASRIKNLVSNQVLVYPRTQFQCFGFFVFFLFVQLGFLVFFSSKSRRMLHFLLSDLAKLANCSVQMEVSPQNISTPSLEWFEDLNGLLKVKYNDKVEKELVFSKCQPLLHCFHYHLFQSGVTPIVCQ